MNTKSFIMLIFGGLQLSAFAQDSAFYENIYIHKDVRENADQAFCINRDGVPVQALHNLNGNLDFHIYRDTSWATINTAWYSVKGDPHDLMARKEGGYAIAARNAFTLIDADSGMSVLKSTGSKWDDWRITSSCPTNFEATLAVWKQNDGYNSSSAIDFVKLAESPDGNYVMALFLYHDWTIQETDGCGAEAFWGLAVADLTGEVKFYTYDLNMKASDFYYSFHSQSRQHKIIEMSKFIHITCLDNEHVAIGYEGWNYTTEQPYNLTVVNFKKIIEDKPLDAQIWQGKIHPDFSEAVFCGLINDDNTLYYCIGQDRYGGKNLLGKARWNGSGFNILESRILEPGGTLNLGMTHLIADLSDEYFVMAGCSYSEASSYTLQPFAVRVQKSDLSTVQPALLIGEDRAFMPLVLNIAPYSKANDETDCIMLFLGSEEYGSPYILTHILW